MQYWLDQVCRTRALAQWGSSRNLVYILILLPGVHYPVLAQLLETEENRVSQNALFPPTLYIPDIQSFPLDETSVYTHLLSKQQSATHVLAAPAVPSASGHHYHHHHHHHHHISRY